jgi:hypothetical protein
MTNRNLRLIMALAVIGLATVAFPVLAQYDRDGRYVPSPNGIPIDPGARPITNYPGTPGAAIGTPQLPRQLTDPPQAKSPPIVFTPTTPPRATTPRPQIVPLTVSQCEDGWSRATHVTPTEFRRRCHLLLKKNR